jgi:hypothetical protein
LIFTSIRRALCIGAALAALMVATPAAAQESRCASCHYANPTAPRPDHLQAWDNSPHDRNNVGCEKCHGGDATTFEKTLAHRGILNSANTQSKVHRNNLPTTCGGCHVGPFVAFQDSKHYELMQGGDSRVATCSTCHGSVDGHLLSAKALASRCDSCHGPRGTAPRSDRAQQVRAQYEGLRAVREEMKEARDLIKRVSDSQRRTALEEEYEQAQVPLTRAIQAGHKFVYDDLRQYLGVAQQRAQALLNKLANR